MNKFAKTTGIAALAAAFCSCASPAGGLETAFHALRDGLWPIAERHADEASKAGGKTAEISRLAKLEALAGKGDYAGILDSIDAWEEESEQFRYRRAWALAKLGRTEEAGNVLAGGKFSDPPLAALAHRLAARLDAAAGNAASAQAHFREVSALLSADAPARAENAVEWAKTLYAAGDRAGAMAVLANEKAAETPGASGDYARLFEAELLDASGRGKEAAAVREKLVAAGAGTAESAFVQAACALARATDDAAGKSAFARKAVARAKQPGLRREAGFLLGFMELADAASRTNGAERIKRLVREFPDAPESREAALALARSLLDAGDAAGAEAEYAYCSEAYPEAAVAGDARAVEGRAWAQLKLGRRTEAIGAFARAAQSSTNLATKAACLCKQAEIMAGEGRYAEATGLFAKVAAMPVPLAGRAEFSRADALERAGKGDEAADAFAAIAKAGGAFAAEAEIRLAGRESAAGRLEQAIETYGRALGRKNLAPELRERALVGQGRACYRAWRFKDAAEIFAAAAEISPGRRDEMRFLMALCKYGEGKSEDAKKDIVSLLETTRDAQLRNDLTLWLARYAAANKEWKKAEEGFETFAATCEKTRPEDAADALIQAARAAGEGGDYAKAVELVTKAAAIAPDMPGLANAYIVQGEALMMLARYDDALRVLNQALTVLPSGQDARRASLLKADALFAMGADDGARYQEALASYDTLAAETGLPASLKIEIAFKTARTLEKMRQTAEADNRYYDGVVLEYMRAAEAGKELLDDSARTFFARAAFALADRYESQGLRRQAVNILKHVAKSGVPAADEARKRIARIKTKGGIQ